MVAARQRGRTMSAVKAILLVLLTGCATYTVGDTEMTYSELRTCDTDECAAKRKQVCEAHRAEQSQRVTCTSSSVSSYGSTTCSQGSLINALAQRISECE